MIKINFDELKPPWISKSEFYKLPFNYCDRWCEKCVLTSICRVYRDEQKTKKKCQKKGIDPNSMECAFEGVRDNLTKAMTMLAKEFKKMKIDLKDLPEDENDDFAEPQSFPLYNLSVKICKKVDEFLDSLIDFVKKPGTQIDEIGNILDYYKNLIPSKVFRAIASQIEEEKMANEPWDSSVSAWITSQSLDKMIEALFFLKENPKLNLVHPKTIKLIKLLNDFKLIIEEKFLNNDYCKQKI